MPGIQDHADTLDRTAGDRRYLGVTAATPAATPAAAPTNQTAPAQAPVTNPTVQNNRVATTNANAGATAGGGARGGNGLSMVEDRITGLLSHENPYMQMARSGAAQRANSRGLLNSSIAAGAGEAAAIQSALPIATSDANAINQARYLQIQGDTAKAVAGTHASATIRAAELANQGSMDRLRYSSSVELQQLGQQLEHDTMIRQQEADSQMERLQYSEGENTARAYANLYGNTELQRQQAISSIISQGWGANHTANAISGTNDSYDQALSSLGSIMGYDVDFFPTGSDVGQTGSDIGQIGNNATSHHPGNFSPQQSAVPNGPQWNTGPV